MPTTRKRGFAFTTEQWKNVEAAIPLPHNKTLLRAARRELQRNILTPHIEALIEAKSDSSSLHLLCKAQATLDKLPPHVALDLRKHIADVIAAMEDQKRRHRGRSVPERQRQLLYEAVLRVWTHTIGHLPKFSRPNGRSGPPTGAVIRFLDAVLRPVLKDNTPKAEGFASIIQRERKGDTR